jgi:hypothetical protein
MYEDLLWWSPPEVGAPEWNMQRDFYQPKGEPAFSEKDIAAEYDNVTGTVTILFSRYLWCSANSLTNAFQMRPGERWVMGFMLMLGYGNGASLFPGPFSPGAFLGTWPEGYSDVSNDSSWWPKLAIDLSNPPATYPSTTSQAFQPQSWDTTLAGG